MFTKYTTLRLPEDTARQLSDHDHAADSWPSGDESRIADDIARAMVECAALETVLAETEGKVTS